MANALDQSVFKVRARRHPAKEVFAGQLPELRINEVGFELIDISESGVGCLSSASNSEDGRWPERVQVVMSQGGRTIFSRDASIARINRDAKRAFFGVSFGGGGAKINELRLANAVALSRNMPLARELKRDLVPSSYKAYCADLATFLQSRLSVIDAHVVPIEPSLTDAERDAIAIEFFAAADEEWSALMVAGNDVSLPVYDDRAARMAMKRYTETLVTPLLVEAPGWARAYFKPLGYPGDFEVMNDAYDGTPKGETVRAKFLQLLGVTS
ncbi:MAG: hypothetical protein AAGJ87_13050, partial [Pseudomonadota bacterium]